MLSSMHGDIIAVRHKMGDANRKYSPRLRSHSSNAADRTSVFTVNRLLKTQSLGPKILESYQFVRLVVLIFAANM